MIKLTAFDIPDGFHYEIIGEYESVQVTGREVRDPDGNLLLNFYDECWFSIPSGNGWYDWTAQAI